MDTVLFTPTRISGSVCYHYTVYFMNVTMRDPARDILRGLTFYEMEYTNHSDYLQHQAPGIDGITYADTIFPTFLFVSGMGSRSTYRNIQTVGLGLSYNLLKQFDRSWVKSPQTITVRPFGVLQRIGLAGLVLKLAPNPARLESCAYPICAIALWMCLSYGMATDIRHPFKKAALSAQTKIDKFVLSSFGPHFTLYTPDLDPEGLLGTLMASVSMWFGAWVSENVVSYNDAFMTGLSLFSFGHMFSYAFPRTCPMNKPYWTLSFMLSTTGVSLLRYTFVKAAVPYLPSMLTKLLSATGKHTLLLFFASAVLDKVGVTAQVKRLVNKFVGGIAGDLISTTVINTGLASLAMMLG